MKKKLILILFLLTFLFTGCGIKNTYKLNIMDVDKISSITVNTLSEYDNLKEINDEKQIKQIYNVFNNRTTKIESISDNPNNPDILFLVTFKDDNNKLTSAYIYKRGRNYYIEQPYNGIYEITVSEFNTIQNLLK